MKRLKGLLLLMFLIPMVSFAQTKKENKKALVKDVTKYIKKEQKKNDGYFKVYDPVTKKDLELQLEEVHSDKFSPMGGDEYFDCANFRGKDGKLYDIDIFMKWNGKKFVSTSKSMVHKVDNKARFVWYEDNGVWKTKKPTKETKMKDGHPAH